MDTLNNVNASDKLTVVNSPIPFVSNSPPCLDFVLLRLLVQVIKTSQYYYIIAHSLGAFSRSCRLSPMYII